MGGVREVSVKLAAEDISKFKVICYSDSTHKAVVTGSPHLPKCTVLGVTIASCKAGANVEYVSSGKVESNEWDFGEMEGATVYLGSGGLPTVNKPKIGSVVEIGTVISRNSFKLNI